MKSKSLLNYSECAMHKWYVDCLIFLRQNIITQFYDLILVAKYIRWLEVYNIFVWKLGTCYSIFTHFKYCLWNDLTESEIYE